MRPLLLIAAMGSLRVALSAPAASNEKPEAHDFWGPKPKNGCKTLPGAPLDASTNVDAKLPWLDCTTGICCYDDETTGLNLGCFTNGPTTKWCHQVDLPDSPDAIDPQFFLYTPDGKEQLLDYRSLRLSVTNAQLDTKLPLYVLVHGFGGEWPKTYMYPQKDALLQLRNNVIIVRWTAGSKGPDYFKATANTRVMGVLVGRVVEALEDGGKASLGSTHLVGFSLGAHVVGYAGATLTEDGRKGLRRIVGLDPAGPLYATGDPLKTDPSTRLNPSNAELVQCMHGNGEPLTHGGAGTMDAFGHVDFYANGGQVQPGCSPGFTRQIKDIKHFHFNDIFGGLACSHDRNTWLFTTSVLMADPHSRGCQFQAIRCNSTEEWEAGRCFNKFNFFAVSANGCPVVGYETDVGTKAVGSYFYATLGSNSSSSDFCGRVWRLSLTAANTVQGEIFLTLSDGQLQGKPYLFQRETETLEQGMVRSKVMVWDWAIEAPTELVISFTAASTKGDQGLLVSLLTLQEFGSAHSYAVAEPPGVAESKKPFLIHLPKAPQT